jgi:hypothetical protein
MFVEAAVNEARRARMREFGMVAFRKDGAYASHWEGDLPSQTYKIKVELGGIRPGKPLHAGHCG